LSKRPSPVLLKENYNVDNFNFAASFQKIECFCRADEY
jgi:cytochrome c oxidase assembly protein Cox11